MTARPTSLHVDRTLQYLAECEAQRAARPTPLQELKLAYATWLLEREAVAARIREMADSEPIAVEIPQAQPITTE